MGRTEPSVRPPPQSFRRAARAKEARRTINKVLPSLLAADYRARKGIRDVELISNAYAWDPELSHHQGTSKKHAGAASAANTAIVVSASGKEKKPGHGGRGGPGQVETGKRNKKGTKKKKGEDSSDDEEAMAEIRAAKEAKQKKNAMREDALNGVESRQDSDTSPDLPVNGSTSKVEAKPKVKILITDTVTAASMLNETLRAEIKAANRSATSTKTTNGSAANISDVNPVSILNMASSLRPGGGFVNGATSQEEHLCMRTTLLPTLHDHFYRIPEFSVIYSPDVLVFRPGDRDRLKAGGHDLLRRRERFYVSVVSAGMLRFPELEGGEEIAAAEQETAYTERRYADDKDREAVERKMQGVLNVMTGKGARGAVLGAWGCGAYGNPLEEIVKAWKKIIASDKSSTSKQTAPQLRSVAESKLTDITFAIKDERMAHEFARLWDDDMEAEYPPREDRPDDPEIEVDEELERLRQERDELEEKMGEIEQQLTETKFPARLQIVLQGLRKQLESTLAAIRARRGEDGSDEADDETKEQDGEEGGVSLESDEVDQDEDDDEDEDEDEEEESGESDDDAITHSPQEV